MSRKRAGARLKQGALVSLALGEIACGHPTTATSQSSSKPTSAEVATSGAPSDISKAPLAPEAAGVDPNLDAATKIKPHVVTPKTIARKTLYTWTTRAQIDELEWNRVLLTRSESPEHGASYFDQLLHKREMANDPLAKMLRTSSFSLARFAWPAPFATLLGIGGESYGDELIEVTLKPEAWIVVFAASQNELSVIDLENRAVNREEALAHPERIAAVYFAQDKPAVGYAASMAGPEERVAYREYVICNESMIASWSIRTESIKQELLAEADALEAIAKRFGVTALPTNRVEWRWNQIVALQTWRSEPTSLVELYESALAFPDEPYRLDPKKLFSLAEKLRALKWKGEPLTHKPTAIFPANRIPSPPPRVKKSRGTH